MALTLIILSCLLWLSAVCALFSRKMLAPAAPLLSFCALVVLSVAKSPEGYPLLPINATILIFWFCMTLIVVIATRLQPDGIRQQTRGVGYMMVGAIVGMVIGLLGFTVSADLSMLYGIMILATVVGVFLGYLLFSRTPDGEAVAPGSGNFFRYLLAKGFPIAITVMQAGVALVLLLAVNRI